MKQTSSLLVSLLLAPLSLSNGFVPVNKRLLKRPVSPSTHTLSPSILPFTSSKCRPTALHMNLLARNIPRPRVAAMIAILLLATTLLRDARNFFWPGARVDAKCEERLPEGSLGCPFIGKTVFYYMHFDNLAFDFLFIYHFCLLFVWCRVQYLWWYKG